MNIIAHVRTIIVFTRLVIVLGHNIARLARTPAYLLTDKGVKQAGSLFNLNSSDS